MATVYVSIGAAGVISRQAGINVRSGAGRSETITSGGTAVSGALLGASGDVATVFCDTAIYMQVNGTASPTTGYYVPAGLPIHIGLMRGESISVLDV